MVPARALCAPGAPVQPLVGYCLVAWKAFTRLGVASPPGPVGPRNTFDRCFRPGFPVCPGPRASLCCGASAPGLSPVCPGPSARCALPSFGPGRHREAAVFAGRPPSAAICYIPSIHYFSVSARDAGLFLYAILAYPGGFRAKPGTNARPASARPARLFAAASAPDPPSARAAPLPAGTSRGMVSCGCRSPWGRCKALCW